MGILTSDLSMFAKMPLERRQNFDSILANTVPESYQDLSFTTAAHGLSVRILLWPVVVATY